jgi:predicted phage baseplate assembly protein
LWREVDSFFFAQPGDLVYSVTLDEDGKALLTFGDGEHGARLPTGQDNVVASYRHGAGAAAPPAGSITQIARGTPGLASVKQPQTASGGSDAESQETVRSTAPRKALTLDRAVSIRDMEAFAADTNGVRSVAVEWAWDKKAQRPVVQVWVVGDAASVAPAVLARLQAVSDPTTPIAVTDAEPVPVTLSLAVDVDEDYVGSEVRDAVAAALLASDVGPLSIEQLGIGKPLYFSRLVAAVHAVAGVQSVSFAWTRTGGPSSSYADTPGTGAYFDLSAGITLDGTEYAHD